MKLYLAGELGWEALEGIRDIGLLWSYHYAAKNFHSRMEMARRNNWHIFVDSGAFTAFTKGETISLSKYIDFCLEWQADCEAVCALDVIKDWGASRHNYERMVAAGVDCIPVFHIGSPLAELARMAHECSYIALGVAGRQSESRVMREWLSKCWTVIIKTNPDCKVHGFALTSFDIMRWFPWHSVDSSSWIQVTRFARVYVHHKHGLFALGQEDRADLRRLLPDSLTIPDDIGQLFLPKKAPTKDYFPLFRHNALSMVDAVARIEEMECSYQQQALMPFMLEE